MPTSFTTISTHQKTPKSSDLGVFELVLKNSSCTVVSVVIMSVKTFDGNCITGSG